MTPLYLFEAVDISEEGVEQHCAGLGVLNKREKFIL
jgi:hypothetical protein